MRSCFHESVISSKYDAPVRETLNLQIIIAILSMLMLDGGIAARVVGAAMLAFWLSVAFLTIRRPFSPPTRDLELIRWGFWCFLSSLQSQSKAVPNKSLNLKLAR